IHNTKQRGEEIHTENLCASFQDVVTEVLVEKTHQAAKTLGVKQIIVAGGVAANKGLRQRLHQSIIDIEVIIPSFKYCTDNAAMIGIAAFYQVSGKKPSIDYYIKGDSSLNFAGK